MTAGLFIQVASFTSKGLSCAGITGTTEKNVEEDVMLGKYQLLFFTPELLLRDSCHDKWRDFLMTECMAVRIKGLVIDEAHTVSTWYKFQKLDANSTSITGAKPSAMHLKKFGEVRSILPKGVHCLCFTTMATKSLRAPRAQGVGCRWAA